MRTLAPSDPKTYTRSAKSIPTMPSTRRRFLTGVTAVTGVLAGCNESTGRAIEETMTPLEVPRTDREILQATNAVDVPSIPPAVVVSEPHLASAIDQLERLRGSLLEAVESRDDPVGEVGYGRERTPEEILERVDERIRRARETGASDEALDAVRGVLDDVARPVGYLRAESGDLTVSDVESAIEKELSAVDAIREDLEYRVATPVTEYFPTLRAAEDAIRRLDGRERPHTMPASEDHGVSDRETASEPEPTPTPEPHSGDVADQYVRLERIRRRRDDVERYLETATDDDAPSLRAPLETELADLRAELATVADEYHTDEGHGGDSLRESVEGMRRSTGSRAGRYLSNTPAEPRDGDLVRILFAGVDRLVSFRSVDAAVSLTLERLDGRRFPVEALLEEKRRAADRVAAAADAPAIGRAFAASAPRILRSGDRRYSEADPTVEELARMHVYYVGAGEWAALGVSRARGLSESLQAQQS